jgi:hypothetical protein
MKLHYLLYAACWLMLTMLPVSAKGNINYGADVTLGITTSAPKAGPPQTMNKEQCVSYAIRLFWLRNKRVVTTQDFNLNSRLLSLHKKYCDSLPSQVQQQSFVEDEDLGFIIVKPLAEKP